VQAAYDAFEQHAVRTYADRVQAALTTRASDVVRFGHAAHDLSAWRREGRDRSGLRRQALRDRGLPKTPAKWPLENPTRN
jgi:hypothetical protein